MILAFDTMNLLVRKFFSRHCETAVDGFVDDVRSIVLSLRPECVVFALEGGSVHREEEHGEYKSNRGKTRDNEELQKQIRQLESILAPLNCIRVPGFEADDVLASLASQHSDCRIVSNDKDLFQLLGLAEMYDPHRGQWITKSFVVEKCGVQYDQVGDWLALKGDETDCVPGVESIGAKTAAMLLREHGSLDKVIEAAKSGGLRGTKWGAKLVEQEDVARMSRRLVELRRDLPLPELRPIGFLEVSLALRRAVAQ